MNLPKLYSFRHSPNPLKIRLALAELGLPHELEEINLFKGEHRSAEFRELNPHQKVPVWQEEGLTLRESNAILVHLGRTRHSELWPIESRWEALAMQWLFFESCSLTSYCGALWWNDVVCKAMGREGSAQAVLDHAVEELERSLGVMEQHLTGREFMLGKCYSLVDCSLGVAAAMLKGTRLELPERWPNVAAYSERIRARDSWKTAGGDGIHEMKR
jgi:glutathione S-transferase